MDAAGMVFSKLVEMFTQILMTKQLKKRLSSQVIHVEHPDEYINPFNLLRKSLQFHSKAKIFVPHNLCKLFF